SSCSACSSAAAAACSAGSGSWRPPAASTGRLSTARWTCWSAACARSSATTRGIPPSSRPSAAWAISSSGAAMTEEVFRPAVHRSVFAKLVVIMLAMALCLMGLVLGFFRFVVNPSVSASVDRMLGDHARRLAADSPGLAEAQRIASRFDVQVRYEGPDGAWTTDETLPTIAAMLDPAPGHVRFAWEHRYLVAAPNGGRYLFVWTFARRARAAHAKLLLLLLASMVAVFCAAHFVLSRALRPLRELQDGVARLAAGDLDVVLPNRTRDEFGALTAAFNQMAERVKDRVRARDQLLL